MQATDREEVFRRKRGGGAELPLLERFVHFLESFLFGDRFLLTGADVALKRTETLLDCLHVRQHQLEIDDLDVAKRIRLPFHVQDVRIVEDAHHVHDRVRLADMRKELIAEPFTLTRALHKTSDVHKLDDRRHFFLGFGKLRKLVDTFIRHRHHSDRRIDRTKWKILRRHAFACYGVKKRRLTDVG